MWGDSDSGGADAPSGNGYTKIYSNLKAFVAIKTDGSIAAWGSSSTGGTTPTPNLANTAGANQIAVIDSAITNITFSNSGGAITSCTVAPTLPAGLSIDNVTCTISGTPTEVKVPTLYTVTAKDAKDNTGNTSFSLMVNVQGSVISKLNRFTEVDFSSANNDNGGYYNASNHPNFNAFATLQADGSITAWGASSSGGIGAPSGNGYTKIYSNTRAFAALKADGSIKAWGDSGFGGTGAPAGHGYTKIYSTHGAFAALNADGSIKAWGDSRFGSTGAPSNGIYTKIYSTGGAFAALKTDGSIKAWGDSGFGGTPPSGSNYTKIYSTSRAFAALKADGSIKAWGHSSYGGRDAPSNGVYTKIYSNSGAFAALKADGSITAWGHSSHGGTGAPAGSDYIKIYSTSRAFAALKADGSIKAWGDSDFGGTGAPSNGVYTKIYSIDDAFAALKADGSIKAWGGSNFGSIAPSDSGYTKIYSTKYAFAALKADGSITAWGNPDFGSTGAPSGSGYTKIYSTGSSFAAIKADGSITTWGLLRHAGIVVSAPNLANAEYQAAVIGSAITDITFSNSGGAIASCTVAPTLPTGLSINSTTCTISGTPTKVRAPTLYTITAKSVSNNTDIAVFSLTVNALAPNLANGIDQVAVVDSSIVDITFSNSGGAITSCTVAPTLPAGLSINSTTCTISGAPIEVRASTVYTVTAANATGQTATATVNLATLLSASALAPTTLTAVATGVPNEVTLSWAGVTGATAYRLYQTTDAAFATAGNSDPSQFSAYSPATTSTDTTATSITMTLSGTATVYYVVTAINGTVESFSNTTPVAATAHAFEFGKVTSSTGQIWMDRNLGASRVATSSTDPASYGDLYQWGRPADGHQIRTSAITATLAANTTPGHANFITITGSEAPYDWTIPHTGDVDGALRSAFFAKTDGSGICPTGFNVPTEAQLKAEVDIWDTTNNAAVGAFNSVLKLPVAGARIRQTGKLGNVGLVAYLWTRSVMPTSWWYRYARYLGFSSYNTYPEFFNVERSAGNSIRCIKN